MLLSVLQVDKYDCTEAVHFATKSWIDHAVGRASHINARGWFQLLNACMLLDNHTAFRAVSRTFINHWRIPFDGSLLDAVQGPLRSKHLFRMQAKLNRCLLGIQNAIQIFTLEDCTKQAREKCDVSEERMADRLTTLHNFDLLPVAKDGVSLEMVLRRLDKYVAEYSRHFAATQRCSRGGHHWDEQSVKALIKEIDIWREFCDEGFCLDCVKAERSSCTSGCRG
jgi:hypothetical protein